MNTETKNSITSASQADKREPYRSPSSNQDLTYPLEIYNLLGQRDITRHDIALASVTPGATPWRHIGAGNCGSVWTYGDASIVLKRADGSTTRYLWKEYYMQTRVLEAFSRMQTSAPEVQVPHCFWYTNTDDKEWWSKQSPMFPVKQCNAGTLIRQEPSNAMCSERIPPVSNSFRHTVIDNYCSPSLKEEIRNSATNADCIARLYLGKRRTSTRPKRYFSLRNHPILLDQAEELDISVLRYAGQMGDALAAMHWEASIDANDVEFVLGSPRTRPRSTNLLSSSTIVRMSYNSSTRWQEPLSYDYSNIESQTHELWLLDFDCCSMMTADDEGIANAVSAFYRNDPYYPRPCSAKSLDYNLWEAFVSRYIATSEAILNRRGLNQKWASTFVEALVAKSKMPKSERYAPHLSQEMMGDSLFYKCFVPQVPSDGQAELDDVVEELKKDQSSRVV